MFNLNEKQLLFLFSVIFLCVTGIVYLSMDQHAEREANKRIDTILEQNKALHSFVENVQKPVIYELKAEGKLYDEWFDPKILSFTYIARNIHNKYKEAKEKNNEVYYQYKLASNNPRNPVNQASPFEKKILEKFNKNELEEFNTIIEEDGKTYYYKALSIGANQASCMRCHSTPEAAPKEMVAMYGDGGYYENVGDIRAMISLKIPITEIQKETMKQFIFITSMIFIIFTAFYFLITRLIRQQKQNREKDALIAEQAKNIALGEMIGNIAHQWRQPLSIISTSASGTKFEKELGTIGDEELLSRLDKINATAQHMSQTINDFSNFLKGDETKSLFNLTNEIEKCLEIEEGVIKHHNILVVKSFDDTIEINNIAHGLTQSLINIITNAKDALLDLEGCRLLFIETKKEKNRVVITIKDNGGGIKSSIIDNIFEPYFTTKHKSQGTGLGLHMTYKIITQNMKGTIQVENETFTYESKEYTGAKFTITLAL